MATKNLGRVVGLSAYEIWLQEGNSGTEIDFLNSLNGKDGYTPIKGTDYFTDTDIAEIVDEVYSKVADGNEVSY